MALSAFPRNKHKHLKKRKQEKLHSREWVTLTGPFYKILYEFPGHCLASSAILPPCATEIT